MFFTNCEPKKEETGILHNLQSKNFTSLYQIVEGDFYFLFEFTKHFRPASDFEFGKNKSYFVGVKIINEIGFFTSPFYAEIEQKLAEERAAKLRLENRILELEKHSSMMDCDYKQALQKLDELRRHKDRLTEEVSVWTGRAWRPVKCVFRY